MQRRRLRAVAVHLAPASADVALPADNPKGTPPKGPGPAPVVFDTELPGAADNTLSPQVRLSPACLRLALWTQG